MDLVNVKKPASIVTASQYKAMEYKVEDNTEEEKKNTPQRQISKQNNQMVS